MAALRVTVVDVFAEQPLAGNQLAVVRDCGALDTDTMQAIAREMNFAETTFVVAEGEGEARVRIFTPMEELPFAGHPTLGTAWVLGRERGFYSLDLPLGRVRVTFEEGGIAWLLAPPVRLGETLSAEAAAELLSVADGEIDTTYRCQVAEVGPSFVLAGVTTAAALRRAKVSPTAYAKLAGNGFLGVFVFCEETFGADADYAARTYFYANGWREDPATGSANAAFAAYLRRQGMGGEIIVEQGMEIARPSRIYLDIGRAIRVGGKVRPVLSGALRYD